MTGEQLAPVIPEIFVALLAMALLMLGVFRSDSATRSIAWLTVVGLAVAFVLVLNAPSAGKPTLAGMFISDPFAVFVKCLILIGSALTIIMSLGFIHREGMARFELPILMLLATLGMMMMVSASNLISLYIGLELQSLSLYVVAAIRRDSLRSTEAGLKYFVLGALSSGMLLYGCSLIYGFTGTTSFAGLAEVMTGETAAHPPIGFIVGLVFLLAGLAFKVSAVPFHMWTPDVYEGAPTPITAFFAVAPKIAAMALFLRVVVTPFPEVVSSWQQIVVFISIASMLLGAFAAINQTNIKRLMAYSSIGHMGYALVGLAAGTVDGVRGVLIYLAIYLAMNVGAFTCILCMRTKEGMVEKIEDLGGLSRNQPMLALALGIFMFSLAGIPPLAGFFGKLYVFRAAIDAELYALAIIGVLGSVVAAFYYLRIVKVMYFDTPAEPFERPIGGEMAVILTVTGVVTLFFVGFAGPLVSISHVAAQALFP